VKTTIEFALQDEDFEKSCWNTRRCFGEESYYLTSIIKMKGG
jgi:hypothetical protein